SSSWKWASATIGFWKSPNARGVTPGPISWWPIRWKVRRRGPFSALWKGATNGSGAANWPPAWSMRSKSFIGSGRMANVLLGVTGSVAAIRTPALYEELTRHGHQVKVVATRAALYFFDPAAVGPLDPSNPGRNKAIVILDEDEWPGRDEGR